ncbi:MAG: hypothetical protein ACTSUD_00945 [Alphaproteobacteria bacterium]
MVRITNLSKLFLGLFSAILPALGAAPAGAAEKGWLEFRGADLKALEYRPKMSLDTVLDYRPAIAGRISQLPPIAVAALPALVRSLESFKDLARRKPGQWTAGRVYLGANAREYWPSDAELLAAVVGNRIRKLLERASLGEIGRVLGEAGIKLAVITYNSFEYRHADVMGSRRYFYCSSPKPVSLSLVP